MTVLEYQHDLLFVRLAPQRQLVVGEAGHSLDAHDLGLVPAPCCAPAPVEVAGAEEYPCEEQRGDYYEEDVRPRRDIEEGTDQQEDEHGAPRQEHVMAREPRFARCLVVDDVVLAW